MLDLISERRARRLAGLSRDAFRHPPVTGAATTDFLLIRGTATGGRSSMPRIWLSLNRDFFMGISSEKGRRKFHS